MIGRLYQTTNGRIVCRICGGEGGAHMTDCDVLTLLTAFEAIAASLGAYVADTRDAVNEAEKLLRG